MRERRKGYIKEKYCKKWNGEKETKILAKCGNWILTDF